MYQKIEIITQTHVKINDFLLIYQKKYHILYEDIFKSIKVNSSNHIGYLR